MMRLLGGRGRLLALFAAVQVMSWSGGANVFALYSGALKTTLGYDQKTLNTLALFKNLGASFGLLPGLILVVAPPQVVMLFGSAMNLVGHLMVYLAVSGGHKAPLPPVPLMCLYIAVAANSQSFCSTGAMVTTLNNFPDLGDRSLVLSLLMGFAGLSGAILAELHRASFM